MSEPIHPVEALRALAQDIAKDTGLQVDHASFDAAKAYVDVLPVPRTIQERVVSLGLLVHTDHVRPPIPTRHFDWAAWDDRTYDGPGCRVGTGPTEEVAVLDLLEQVEADRYEEEDLP